jgi:hypothetical protein
LFFILTLTTDIGHDSVRFDSLQEMEEELAAARLRLTDEARARDASDKLVVAAKVQFAQRIRAAEVCCMCV